MPCVIRYKEHNTCMQHAAFSLRGKVALRNMMHCREELALL